LDRPTVLTAGAVFEADPRILEVVFVVFLGIFGTVVTLEAFVVFVEAIPELIFPLSVIFYLWL